MRLRAETKIAVAYPQLDSTLRSATPVDMANTLFADAYAIVGAKLGQRISRNWSWFIEGRNLGNRKYVATTNVVLNQAGADGPLFFPGDGRGFYTGLEWKL